MICGGRFRLSIYSPQSYYGPVAHQLMDELDIHKRSIVAACIIGCADPAQGPIRKQTLSFGTTPQGLLALHDWLSAEGKGFLMWQWGPPTPIGTITLRSISTTCWKRVSRYGCSTLPIS